MTSEVEGSTRDPCHLRRIPVELREEIYGHLLRFQVSTTETRHRRNSYFCYPAILRTCRFVYEEALPLLAQENTLQFDIWDGYWRDDDGEALYEGREWPGWHLTMNGHRLEDYLPLSKELARVDIAKCRTQGTQGLGLPSCVQHARKVQFHIQAAVEEVEHHRERRWIPLLARTNHILFLFALAFSDARHLEEVDIVLEDETWMTSLRGRATTPRNKADAIARGLYPIISAIGPGVVLKATHQYLGEIDPRGPLRGTEEISDPRTTILRSCGPADTLRTRTTDVVNDFRHQGALLQCWRDYCKLEEIAQRLKSERVLRELRYEWNVDSFANPGFYDGSFVEKISRRTTNALRSAEADLQELEGKTSKS